MCTQKKRENASHYQIDCICTVSGVGSKYRLRSTGTCVSLDHHEGHFVVFIAVQNLVGIDAVVLIICMFLFREFGLKTPVHAPKIGGFGGFCYMGSSINETPRRHILAQVRVV